MIKLTVIGGCGSRCLMLAKSLAKKTAEYGIDEIVFLDNDLRRLQIFGSMVEEVFHRLAPDTKILCTSDEVSALEDASFVIATIRAGKEDGRILDEKLALKYGLIGQETTGIGGFAMALRSIPSLKHYCGLIQKHSRKDVMLFNFTNPAGLVTQALRDLGYDFVYGICDAPSGLLRQIANMEGLPHFALQVKLAGLNHLSFFTSIRFGEKELLPELLDKKEIYELTDMRYFEPDLARHLGCVLNEYLYYFYYREKALRNIQKSGRTRGEHIKQINEEMLAKLTKYDAKKDFEQMLQIYAEYTYQRESQYMRAESSVARDASCIPKFDLYTSDEGGYAGVALALIKAKMTGEKGEMILCIPNRGALDWLEPEDVIEISCNISSAGAKPKAGPYVLPDSAKELIRSVKYYERTAAKAILEQSVPLALDALMVHPLIHSYSLAKDLLREYLLAYKTFTGGWGL